MAHEIKFRAWDKKTKKMFAVHELNFAEENGKTGNVELIRGYSSVGCTSFEGRDMFGSYNVSRFELMQYTNLHDKNGKEIYEGDIIKYNFKSLTGDKTINRERISKVFWQEFRATWAVNDGRFCNSDLFQYVKNGNVVEVIGNIYENPDLLK